MLWVGDHWDLGLRIWDLAGVAWISSGGSPLTDVRGSVADVRGSAAGALCGTKPICGVSGCVGRGVAGADWRSWRALRVRRYMRLVASMRRAMRVKGSMAFW